MTDTKRTDEAYEAREVSRMRGRAFVTMQEILLSFTRERQMLAEKLGWKPSYDAPEFYYSHSGDGPVHTTELWPMLMTEIDLMLEGMRRCQVVVNGRLAVLGCVVSYGDLCAVAGFNPALKPTITYSHGRNGEGGSIVSGEVLPLGDGMRIEIADTGTA